jgi:putative oxidoreductase
MKILTIIVRILLGLMFVVFGLNGFYKFIPEPKEPPTGHALEFFSALSGTGYLKVIMSLQLIGGVLVLSGRFLPLGLLVLGPIVVNILLYHIYIDHKGLELAVVTSALALFLLCRHWSAFAAVFRPYTPASTSPPASS